MASTLLILSNSKASSFPLEQVFPLLSSKLRARGVSDYKYHVTEDEESAAYLARTHILEQRGPIMAAGGDGTIHALVNHLVGINFPDGYLVPLIIFPSGTANALFSSLYPPLANAFTHEALPTGFDASLANQLRSLLAYIDDEPRRSLAISVAELFVSGNSQPISTTYSIVVNSTSLHAAILDSAEKYRAEIPGIERFKVAAGENITNWSYATAELLPDVHSNSVLRYDPTAKEFKLESPSAMSLEGPFCYFLSTINVDRLEPFFITTPLTRSLPPQDSAALDVIVVRPSRNPAYQGDSIEARQAFVNIGASWFKEIYSGGKHVDMVYGQVENPVYVTEYYRVGGWRWTPKGTDGFSCLACVDGTVLSIPPGGHLNVFIESRGKTGRVQFTV